MNRPRGFFLVVRGGNVVRIADFKRNLHDRVSADCKPPEDGAGWRGIREIRQRAWTASLDSEVRGEVRGVDVTLAWYPPAEMVSRILLFTTESHHNCIGRE